MAKQINARVQGRNALAVEQRAAGGIRLEKRRRTGETIIQGLLFFCGAVSILTTLGIVYVLGREAWLFFGDPEISLVEYFTSTTWQPQLGNFGVLPLIEATLITTFIAILVAVPLGLAAALYLSEYASPRVRGWVKPVLEVLAGVPTVVYGYFALYFATPIIRSFLPAEIYNTLSPGLVMGVMITPLISSMSEDALSAVPRSLREGAYGLGATRWEVATRVMVPAALSGIVAAFIVAVSRAIGETMIVAVAAGAGPNWTWPPNPLVAAETMTGHIARISSGDISYNSIQYNSLFSIGLTLFVMTLVLNLLSQRVVRRFREVYE